MTTWFKRLFPDGRRYRVMPELLDDLNRHGPRWALVEILKSDDVGRIHDLALEGLMAGRKLVG